MFGSLFEHPYTRELQKNAKLLKPNEQTRQKILGTVMAATGVAASVSVAAALAKSIQAARIAFVKTAASVAATAVGVSVMGVAGASMVIPPSIEAAYIASQDWHVATVLIDTSSVMQPESVVIVLSDGSAWIAEHTGGGTYEVRVPQNGDYQVRVTGQGGQTATAPVHVEGLDNNIPHMQEYAFENDLVRLCFADDYSGVDWASICAVDSAGNTVQPQTVNAAEGYVLFEVPQSQMDVLVQDLAGNRAVCTIRIG